MINIAGYIVSNDEMDKLKRLESDLVTLQEQNGELQATATQALKDKAAALETERIANEALAKAVIVNRDLSAQLQARPLPGISRKPIITKTEMKDVAGVAVPKGNAPSAAQDQNARDLMLIASMMGFNAWRGFFNLPEVRTHTASTMIEGNINHLPGYGRRLGLAFIADTVNNAAVNLSDPDLDMYVAGLIKMGAVAFVFDDANQYRDTTKYPAGKLETLVERIRKRAPNMPLIASLTANATINDYKPLFDFVEAQTFGRITELEGFFKRGFDVYCLDGRKEISVDYLTKAIEIVAANRVSNLFYYVTAITDWKNMTAQLPLIKQNVTRWMSMAR